MDREERVVRTIEFMVTSFNKRSVWSALEIWYAGLRELLLRRVFSCCVVWTFLPTRIVRIRQDLEPAALAIRSEKVAVTALKRL